MKKVYMVTASPHYTYLTEIIGVFDDLDAAQTAFHEKFEIKPVYQDWQAVRLDINPDCRAWECKNRSGWMHGYILEFTVNVSTL